MDEDQALFLPILRRQAKAATLHFDGVQLALDRLTLDEDLAAVKGIGTENAFEQFRTARAEHTGNAKHFPALQPEADVGEFMLPAEIPHLQNRFIGG